MKYILYFQNPTLNFMGGVVWRRPEDVQQPQPISQSRMGVLKDKIKDNVKPQTETIQDKPAVEVKNLCKGRTISPWNPPRGTTLVVSWTE